MAATSPPRENLAQKRFNETYITSSEISRDAKVSRPSVMRARERRLLPDAIFVGDGSLCIWERATVAPYLEAWKKILEVRRSNSE